jgi:recombination protein RecR
MNGPEITELVRLLARLPGLGPRSARRAALLLLKKKDQLLDPLAKALAQASKAVVSCRVCGNLDTLDPCTVCADERRDRSLVCVVEDVADLWAIERTAGFKGVYHVLGGTLSALDGRGPQDLNVASLVERCARGAVRELVLALNATVDGQTTAHYIADRLKESPVAITRLAHGVPVGGELDYLDDGTLLAALKARRAVG